MVYDDDGGSTDEYMYTQVGEVYEACEGKYRFAGGPETIRLESKSGYWIEITPKTLNEYFEQEGSGDEGTEV